MHAREIPVTMAVRVRTTGIIRSVSFKILNSLFYQNQIILKLYKIFECFCVNGFTGDFCEFKVEQDHLLFVSDVNSLVFNASAWVIKQNALVDKSLSVDNSCSTMLNGEAIILGGGPGGEFDRQVWR